MWAWLGVLNASSGVGGVCPRVLTIGEAAVALGGWGWRWPQAYLLPLVCVFGGSPP